MLNNIESGSWFSNFNDAFDVVVGIPSIDTTGGRWGGRCPQLQLAGGTSHGFGWNLGAGVNERIVQFAFRLSDASGTSQLIPLVRAMEGNVSHAELCVNPQTGKFRFSRNLTGLGAGESSQAFAVGVWYYGKVRFLIHDSAGEVEFLLSGGAFGTDTSIISLTGLDTRNGGVGDFDRVFWGNVVATGGGALITSRYQDFAVCDTTGAAPMNDFHAEGRILVPGITGNGDVNDWTASPAVANYLNVDETPNDGNTTYNHTDTVNDEDLFTHAGVGSPSTVYGVKVSSMMAKDTAGTDNVRSIIKTGGTVYEGPSIAVIGSTYAKVPALWEDNPGTTNPFTSTEVNAMQVGYKRVV